MDEQQDECLDFVARPQRPESLRDLDGPSEPYTVLMRLHNPPHEHGFKIIRVLGSCGEDAIIRATALYMDRYASSERKYLEAAKVLHTQTYDAWIAQGEIGLHEALVPTSDDLSDLLFPPSNA